LHFTAPISPAVSANGVTGTFTATATVSGVATPLVYHLTNTAAVPVLTSIRMSGQFFQFTAGTQTDLSVALLDQFGGPFARFSGTVHFSSTDGQASLPADYTFTAADAGQHLFPGGLIPRTAGTQTFSVSDTSGSGLNMSFTTTTVPAAATVLSVVSGDGQSAAVNQPFAQPLVVQVSDAYGNGIQYAQVLFRVPTDEPSGLIDGKYQTGGAQTDANGYGSINVTAGYTPARAVYGRGQRRRWRDLPHRDIYLERYSQLNIRTWTGCLSCRRPVHFI
jgi:hypothetical protein